MYFLFLLILNIIQDNIMSGFLLNISVNRETKLNF